MTSQPQQVLLLAKQRSIPCLAHLTDTTVSRNLSLVFPSPTSQGRPSQIKPRIFLHLAQAAFSMGLARVGEQVLLGQQQCSLVGGQAEPGNSQKSYCWPRTDHSHALPSHFTPAVPFFYSSVTRCCTCSCCNCSSHLVPQWEEG